MGLVSPIQIDPKEARMGVYRHKDSKGRFIGEYIVQFPYDVDQMTGKTKYTTTRAGLSKRDANALLAQKLREFQEKKRNGLQEKTPLTFENLAEWYLKLEKVQEKKSFGKIQQHCRTLVEHFGLLMAEDIKASMVETYQQKRLRETNRNGDKFKPASVNRELEVMKRIYNLAIRDDLLEKNPCWKVERLPENNARDRVLTQEELAKLIEVLPRHAAEIVTMGYWTGMRADEIFSLTWDRVHLEEGYLVLRHMDTKTNKGRLVFFAPTILQMLEKKAIFRSEICEHVFSYEGRPIKRIDKALKTAMRKVGIEDFTFHDLRHTFNTNSRRAGVPDVVTMKLTGHTTRAMFDRYSTVDKHDGKEAVRKLEEYFRRATTGDGRGVDETTSNSTSQEKRG